MVSGTLSVAGRAELDAILNATHGVAAVREVALHPWRHGMTEPAVDPCAYPEVRLTLLRTKFKPGRKLTAYYRRDSSDGRSRHLAVSWLASAGPGTEGSISVLAYPDDPALPQLDRLADPAYLAHLVGALPTNEGATGRRDGWSAVPVPVPLRYRPGQRHVLLVGGAGHGNGLVLKTDKHRSGHRAVPAARGLATLLAGECPQVDVAEPLGFSARDAASLWRLAPGTALSSEITAGRSGVSQAIALVGQAMRVVHDRAATHFGADAVARLPRHDLAAEVDATLRAGEHIGPLLPDVGQRYEQVATEAALALGPSPANDVCVLHGDLKCENLLVERTGARTRIRILDLDRVCVGDPALDLGKLLADLRWWSSSPRGAAEAALRAGYGPGAEARWARAALVSAVFDLKLAARRCMVHDPEWAPRVRGRVDVAATTLARAGQRP